MNEVDEFTKKVDAGIVEAIKKRWIKEAAENNRKRKWYHFYQKR